MVAAKEPYITPEEISDLLDTGRAIRTQWEDWQSSGAEGKPPVLLYESRPPKSQMFAKEVAINHYLLPAYEAATQAVKSTDPEDKSFRETQSILGDVAVELAETYLQQQAHLGTLAHLVESFTGPGVIDIVEKTLPLLDPDSESSTRLSAAGEEVKQRSLDYYFGTDPPSIPWQREQQFATQEGGNRILDWALESPDPRHPLAVGAPQVAVKNGNEHGTLIPFLDEILQNPNAWPLAGQLIEEALPFYGETRELPGRDLPVEYGLLRQMQLTFIERAVGSQMGIQLPTEDHRVQDHAAKLEVLATVAQQAEVPAQAIPALYQGIGIIHGFMKQVTEGQEPPMPFGETRDYFKARMNIYRTWGRNLLDELHDDTFGVETVPAKQLISDPRQVQAEMSRIDTMKSQGVDPTNPFKHRD